MFTITCNIELGPYESIPPHAVKISRSIDNYSDSATIKLPGVCRLKTGADKYENVPTALQFKEGMTAVIYGGYNGDNSRLFKGFIRRINFATPVEIECEGYSYQLRLIKDYSKSYKATTVLQILKDLVKGTAIKLSRRIPNIPLTNIFFKNVSGVEVLDYLKKKCLLTVYFNNEEMYAGLQEAEPKDTVKFRLGWNVIKDDDLKFEDKKENANVKIMLQSPTKTGHKKTAEQGPKDGNVKVIKVRHIQDQATLNKMAEAQKDKLVYKGYEGKITCFLQPYAEPGMAAFIDDAKYPERTGKYFIEGVETEVSPAGGRQKISIGARL